MKAIFNKVIIKPSLESNKTKHGFYTGEQESEKFKKGEVISVGDDVENIKVGEIAWYDKHRCSDIKLNGEVYDIMENINIFVIED